MAPSTAPDWWEADVVLADGGSAHVRPMRSGDESRVRDLYARMSDRSRFLRFFAPLSPAAAARLDHAPDVDDPRFTLVAEIGRDIVGIAEFDEMGEGVAEVAFAVQDHEQGRGLGTVLLEHLARVATTRGIDRFVANVLAENHQMLRVLTDVGFTLTSSRPEPGVCEAILHLAPTDIWNEAHDSREQLGEALSVARLLAPSSIAVIGASRRPDAVGHAVLQNLLDGGYTGSLFPVNPNATSVAGIRAWASVLDIPGRVDLAIVTVPASAVLDVARECAAKGVHGLVVISGGFAELEDQASRQADLVAIARGNDMRVIGPNCVGVINTHPAVRMNATFAEVTPAHGRIGFASQSGGIGIELLARAEDRGLGVSTFVSLGNKADVSSNDVLQYWDRDPDTDVILLYLESFGNPQKFSRLAKRIARRKPIIAMKSGRTPAGARGAQSHTAALANSDVVVDELFHQAGVVRVDTLEELLDTAALLAHQPLPGGSRVAIVSNGGGPGILAADAAVAAGLEVPELSGALQASLRVVAAPGAGIRNPVDLVASADATAYEATIDQLLDSPEVDAVLVIHVPTRGGDADEIERAITAAGTGTKPLAVCLLGRDAVRTPAASRSRLGPAFAFPESAARALAHAARLAEWRARPVGHIPELDALDHEQARTLIEQRIAEIASRRMARPRGNRGDPELLRDTRRPERPGPVRCSSGRRRRRLSDAVAIKAADPRLVHKSDVGGVRLGLRGADSVGRRSPRCTRRWAIA